MKSILELLREKDEYANAELQKEAPVVCALRNGDLYIYTKRKQYHPGRIFHYECSSVSFAFYGAFSDIEEVRRSFIEMISEFATMVNAKDLTGQYLVFRAHELLREKYEHYRRGMYRVGVVVADLIHGTIYTVSPNGDYELWKGEAYLGTLPGAPASWDAIKSLKTIPAIRSHMHKLCKHVPGIVDELTIRATDE